MSKRTYSICGRLEDMVVQMGGSRQKREPCVPAESPRVPISAAHVADIRMHLYRLLADALVMVIA